MIAGVAECQAYYDELLRSTWWKHRWPHIKKVRIKDGRGTRKARGSLKIDFFAEQSGSMEFTIRSTASALINLPRWARREWVMLHELAHSVTPDSLPAHGPDFAANYLTLIHHKLGRDAEQQLLDAFIEHRVRVAGLTTM